jgi:hypothetical protein
METTVNERVAKVVSLKTFGNKRKFDSICGFGENYTGSIIGSRNSQPSADALNKIIKAFPDINPNWLLNGTGEMLELAKQDVSISLLERVIERLEEELERYRKREDFFMSQQAKYKGGESELVHQPKVIALDIDPGTVMAA